MLDRALGVDADNDSPDNDSPAEAYARLELWDTGLSPHYDVVYIGADRPDVLVEALLAVPFTTMINPHYDPDGGLGR